MAISTKFGQSQEYFGTEDYRQARKQGKTAADVLDFISANFGKFSPGKRNQPGGGGLYDMILSDYRKEQRDALAKQSNNFSNQIEDLKEQQQLDLSRQSNIFLGQLEALREQNQNSLAQQEAERSQQLAAFQKASAEKLQALQRASAENLQAFQTQFSEQNRLNQEKSRREMLIGLQSRDKGPAPVRTAASRAQQQGLTTRGSTGYFGRQGMRIGALNV